MANFQHHSVNLSYPLHPDHSGRPLSNNLEEPRQAPRHLLPHQVFLALRVPRLLEASVTLLRTDPVL